MTCLAWILLFVGGILLLFKNFGFAFFCFAIAGILIFLKVAAQKNTVSQPETYHKNTLETKSTVTQKNDNEEKRPYFVEYNWFQGAEEFVTDFVAIDFETTGLSASQDQIIQIGAVKYIDGKETETYTTYVKPSIHIPKEASFINNIFDSTVASAPSFEQIAEELLTFIGDYTLIAHNAPFDMKFLQTALHHYKNRGINNPVIDTLRLSRYTWLDLPNYKLDTLKTFLNIETQAHHALADSKAAAEVYMRCYEFHNPTNFDTADENIYFCFTAEDTMMCESERLRAKEDIAFIAYMCENHGGRFLKTVNAKTAKFAILISPNHYSERYISKYHQNGFKVTRLPDAMEFLLNKFREENPDIIPNDFKKAIARFAEKQDKVFRIAYINKRSRKKNLSACKRYDDIEVVFHHELGTYVIWCNGAEIGELSKKDCSKYETEFKNIDCVGFISNIVDESDQFEVYIAFTDILTRNDKFELSTDRKREMLSTHPAYDY